jgi:hypothetical protein
MSKLTRYTQQVFGSSAGTNQIAQFGSYVAGSPVYTTNPATIQALAEYLDGWFAAVVNGSSPAIEDMNALHYLFSYGLAYLMQEGVAEWDSGTTYYQYSLCNYSGVLYVSQTNSNLNNTPGSSPSNWVAYSQFSGLTVDGVLYASSSTTAASTSAGSQYQPLIANSSGAPSFQALALNQSAAITGTLAIANGGTGAASASAAFNALSPVTSTGDLILGNGTNSATRLGIGSNGQVLQAGSTTASWQTLPGNSTALKIPTVQKFTSGSGTYTTPSSPSPLYLKIKMVGGGSGGTGSSTAVAINGGTGGTGGNTTFGTSLLVANGGVGGSTFSGGATPATASLGSGPVGLALSGAVGGAGFYTNLTTAIYGQGGTGAASPLGGGGAAGGYGSVGTAAGSNTGAGGGGGGATSANANGIVTGCGGSAGAYVEAIITSPGTSYSYAVGAGGAAGSAGTSGYAGGAGGSGVIIVEEHYQ